MGLLPTPPPMTPSERLAARERPFWLGRLGGESMRQLGYQDTSRAHPGRAGGLPAGSGEPALQAARCVELAAPAGAGRARSLG